MGQKHSAATLETPDLETPDLETPDLSAPDLSAPDLSAPDLSTPDLSTPDLSTPDLSAPDLSAPNLSIPDPDIAVVSSAGLLWHRLTHTPAPPKRPPRRAEAATTEDRHRRRQISSILYQVHRPDLIRVREDEALSDHYQVESVVMGRTALGHVRRAVCLKTGMLRAVISVNTPHLEFPAQMKNAMYLMRAVDHPNILQVFEVFDNLDTIHVVTQLCHGGSLLDCLVKYKRFSEATASVFFRQVLSVVAYLNDIGIVHRDIVPSNFLFATTDYNSTLKLSDFSYARLHKAVFQFSEGIGHSHFTAPEILHKHYTKPADAWSAGVLLFMLVTGQMPYQDRLPQDLLMKIRFEEPNFRPCAGLSEGLVQLLRGLLHRDPKLRWTAQRAMHHPWLRDSTEDTIKIPKDLLSNFETFTKLGRFKRAILTALPMFLIEEDRVHFDRLFRAFDRSRTGTMKVVDVVATLDHFGVPFCQNIYQTLEQVDADCSGAIDYIEFFAAGVNKHFYFLCPYVFWAAFQVFDRDGDGFISVDDIQATMHMKHYVSTGGDSIPHQMMAEADLDGNGEIDFDEFVLAVRHIADNTPPPPGRLDSPWNSSQLAISRNSYQDGVVTFKPDDLQLSRHPDYYV